MRRRARRVDVPTEFGPLPAPVTAGAGRRGIRRRARGRRGRRPAGVGRPSSACSAWRGARRPTSPAPSTRRSALDWVLCVADGAGRRGPPRRLRSTRGRRCWSPTTHGVRIRLGRTWRGLTWGALERGRGHRPRRGLSATAALVLVPRNAERERGRGSAPAGAPLARLTERLLRRAVRRAARPDHARGRRRRHRGRAADPGRGPLPRSSTAGPRTRRPTSTSRSTTGVHTESTPRRRRARTSSRARLRCCAGPTRPGARPRHRRGRGPAAVASRRGRPEDDRGRAGAARREPHAQPAATPGDESPQRGHERPGRRGQRSSRTTTRTPRVARCPRRRAAATRRRRPGGPGRAGRHPR